MGHIVGDVFELGAGLSYLHKHALAKRKCHGSIRIPKTPLFVIPKAGQKK